MSASTRSFATSVALLVALACAVAPAAAQSPAPAWCGAADGPLPAAVRAAAPALEVSGVGNLRWFGLPVYDARLWAPPGGWVANAPFALEIRYARQIRGEQLASRSIDEMRHIGRGSDTQHAQWRAAMNRVFPDVREGDCLLGFAAAGGPTRFFVNGKPTGAVDDPEFTQAFFGIWLSPATSEPKLRSQLLGERK